MLRKFGGRTRWVIPGAHGGKQAGGECRGGGGDRADDRRGGSRHSPGAVRSGNQDLDGAQNEHRPDANPDRVEGQRPAADEPWQDRGAGPPRPAPPTKIPELRIGAST